MKRIALQGCYTREHHASAAQSEPRSRFTTLSGGGRPGAAQANSPIKLDDVACLLCYH
jgi:hypothetical protein